MEVYHNPGCCFGKRKSGRLSPSAFVIRHTLYFTTTVIGRLQSVEPLSTIAQLAV